MNIGKKIVLCLHCRYFPTQVDHSNIAILEKHLTWTCPACQQHNVYRKDYVLLPQNSYLRVTTGDILKGD